VDHPEDMASITGPLAVRNINMLSGSSECRTSYCSASAVIALAGQDLCLDHFLACCYQRLDRLEQILRSRYVEGAEILDAGAFLKECSNLALFICLRHEHLSNVDRSRLLNILLLSGDLQLRLCKPLVKNADHAGDIFALAVKRATRLAGND
jgi:hypothetical protein